MFLEFFFLEFFLFLFLLGKKIREKNSKENPLLSRAIFGGFRPLQIFPYLLAQTMQNLYFSERIFFGEEISDIFFCQKFLPTPEISSQKKVIFGKKWFLSEIGRILRVTTTDFGQ